MDASRFDALARTLATRLSRRGALRGGAGLTAGLIGLHGVRSTAAITNPALKRYTAVHQFASNATATEVKNALGGLIPQLQQIAGFIDYSVVNASGDVVLTIATFVDADGLAQAEQLEKRWIADNAADLLPSNPDVAGGPVILNGGTGAGCPCITGTENPCGSDQLACCATTDLAGGPGICVDAQIGCGGTVEPACKAPGDPCEMVPEHGCCEGYTCFEGICDNPKGCFDPGEPCSSDADCCQGSCSEDGRCYCNDPSRPQIGCACDPADANACGGRTELCCGGACISPMAECQPPEETCGVLGDPCTIPDDNCCEGFSCFEGVCDNPKGCFDPGGPCTVDSDCCQGSCSESGICYCSDPDRPDIGCACDPADTNACGGRPELCCTDTCISPMANC